MPHTIAILDNINLLPEAQKRILSLVGNAIMLPEDNNPTETELIARTGNAEAILISPRVHITAAYLDACPSVRYIGVCGTSTANVDEAAVAKRGITLANVVDYGDEPAAKFIFMQLVTLARGMGPYQWRDMPCELMGKSIGIIGLGALGGAIAHLALAYKMQVSYYSPHRKPMWEQRGVHYKEPSDLAASSDIVVISSPSNMPVLGKAEFAHMKPGTILVQASMGNVFDKKTFLEWIAKKGNFALFDSSAGEQNYQAFKDIPRVIFATVYAGYSYETKKRLGQKVYDQLQSYFEATGRPAHQ